MRIYRMTATFGKLRHETLSLEPGLNVITAPNEWGKSTWCAFLMAMLYGLDTRVKSTKTALADKERFAPWSGEPMSGRIDLNWEGRDITIERDTRQRVPLGEFRAYETKSGVAVPELTAANCGAMLLGVEREVYRRAGFIRHADMPVTQDESLRRRLNALVTTGDERGGAERLAQQLKELKNRVRYNRSGLLPQAEAERETLEKQLEELKVLKEKSSTTRSQLDEIKSWLSRLYNHQQALAYNAYRDNLTRLEHARQEQERSQEQLTRCAQACKGLPEIGEARKQLRELQSFREEWYAILREQQGLTVPPAAPVLGAPYEGMTAEEAEQMAHRDAKLLSELSGSSKGQMLLLGIGAVGILAALGLYMLTAYLFAAAAGVVALVALGWGMYDIFSGKAKRAQLVKKYNGADPKKWTLPVAAFRQAMAEYERRSKAHKQALNDLEVRMLVLRKRRDALCGSQTPEQVLEQQQNTVSALEALDAAQREHAQAEKLVKTLQEVTKQVDKPATPDDLTQSETETANLLSECALEQQRLQNRLGQYQGRMAALGEAEDLNRLLEKKNARVRELENTYSALTIAQETLSQAMAELQRRFAPRITRQAQGLLSRLTGGRYRSLVMLEDFTLEAQADQEDTLHTSLFRSDGTVDQLYLAVRLAVAQELTPGAPLILDDCLVRFDDERMKAAIELLKELSIQKQVILFTCHSREAQV